MGVVPVRRNPKNKFTVATCHYSLDPEKNTPEWIALAKEGMTERGWNREYEIDYTSFAGKPVFDNFKQYNIFESKYKPGEILYRGWDYGYHHPAVIITKLNEHDQWCWLRGILGSNEGIYDFGLRIKRFCESEYPGAKFIDAGDPAGEAMSDKSEKSSVEILRSMGIAVRSRKQPIKKGIEIIRQKLNMRADGKPGLLVNPDQTILIDGFKGGWHYPEIKEGVSEPEYYEKDGYFDHLGDAARYISVEMFDVIGNTQLSNEISRDENELMYQMGSSNYGNNDILADGISDFFG